MNTKKNPEPLKMTKCTTKPWTNLVVDFFGPLPDGSEIMILKDTQSKMVVADEVKSTSSQNVLPVIESVISLMGIPEKIKSDNGPPFNGHEFKEFCEVFGIKHTPITPLHPESNGQCEVFMKNMNKIVKIARNGNRSWRQELNSFLRNYRTTPHSSTGVAPNDLIFRHSNSSKLPKWSETSNNEYKRLILKALNKNKKANQIMKKNADKKQTRIKI
jgi:transposase InsO family protein